MPSLIAAFWGFAEATLFFFVPDVYLSRLALADLRGALRACVWALAGALAGGALMFAWGARDPTVAERVVAKVPAISTGAISAVRRELEERQAAAVFLGPLKGTPYKIYAVEAPRAGMSLARFLAVSVPARLLRFLLVTLLFAAVRRSALRSWPAPRLAVLHGAVWAVFYAVYFALKDW